VPLQAEGDAGDLVAAAREQTKAALQLADEAEGMARQMPEGPQRRDLLAAIGRLRENCAAVMRTAEASAADPDNIDLALELDMAQRKLALSLQEVVRMTSLAGAELEQALNAMVSAEDKAVGDLFELSQQLIARIRQFVQEARGWDAKTVVENAKAIADLVNQLSRVARTVADQAQDPKYKEQMTQMSRCMRDKATQMKMIAAVKVACGGDSSQVTSAADGLLSTVSECVNIAKVQQLKNRVKNSADRANAIRNLLRVWMQHRQ
jgi:hypothetical protein